MNSFLNYHLESIHINQNQLFIQGEIAHAHYKILKICLSGARVTNQWILFGIESTESPLRDKLLQPQTNYCGYLGVCDFEDLDLVKLEATYEDGSIETISVSKIIESSGVIEDASKKSDLTSQCDLICKGDYNVSETIIILPTFQPDLGYLFEQIDSIRKQNYQSWHCLILDDASDDLCIDAIKRLIGSDDRFTFYKNKSNLGFYLNIERALMLIDEELQDHNFQYVSFSDQDDFWFPEKLEQSVEFLRSNVSTKLVYCDQKIVDKDLQIIQDGFWTSRSMNIAELDKLLLTNCVTGGASVFRYSLLEAALPFPKSIGKMYHDHWFGLLAYLDGGLDFISDSLYAYRQHDAQDTGYGDSKRNSHNVVEENLNRVSKIIDSRECVSIDELTYAILKYDIGRLATLARALLHSSIELKEEDKGTLELFSLKDAKKLFEYLRKQVEFGLSSDIEAINMGEEAYILPSALIATLGDGNWRKMKVTKARK